jgi:hypothetical protein
MASIQKSVDAYKTIHRDYQQLDNVKTILVDCTQNLNDTQKSRKEIAKLTKLSLEVITVLTADTQAGLKSLAPSHSFATVMKSDEAEKRRGSRRQCVAVAWFRNSFGYIWGRPEIGNQNSVDSQR